MSDNSIQEIKERLNVSDVVGSYVALKKSGTNFKAICPFHNEKSASLMISPKKQIWHCFGCGEGGDIFEFVSRYENFNFRETLELLAKQAGVTLQQRDPQSNQKKQLNTELIRINNFAAAFYAKFLHSKDGAAAKKYILDRGLNKKTIERWQVGFAPDNFNSLKNALATKKVDVNKAVTAGVIAKNDKGNFYDRFRDRVTFPIHNYYGEVVGFSARALKDGDYAKYINSPETPIYNKSTILFGLHFGREAIRKADEVVVVEGQMDCIQAHQAGFSNTVASSGTALTEQHLNLLSRLTKNITFSFDSDDAGLKALRRAGELALPQGFRIKVIALDGAKDPDELIKDHPGQWKKAVKESVWFIDYYLGVAEKQFEMGSLEQSTYVSEEIVPLIQFLADPLERDHFVRKITKLFGISETAIKDSLKQLQRKQTQAKSPARTASSKSRQPALKETPPVEPMLIQEKEMLGGIILFPEFRAFVLEEGLPSEYLSERIEPLINQALLDENASVSQIDPFVNEAQFMIESMKENLDNNELVLISELKKTFYLFKVLIVKRQLQEVTKALKLAELANDESQTQKLQQDFANLTKQRYALEQKLG